MNDSQELFEFNQTVLHNSMIRNDRRLFSGGGTSGKGILFLFLACFFLIVLMFCSSVNAGQSDGASGKRRIINPWTWQDRDGLFGFVHANEITDARRLLFTAGQVSVGKDGNLLHPNDMPNQISQVLDNLETLLARADMHLKDVVRFTYYTTDIRAFMTPAARQVLSDRLQKSGCKPATSLIGVKSLFHPDCVIEIEAVVAD